MTVTLPGPVVTYEYFDQLWRSSRTHNAATNIQALSEYQTSGGVNYSLVSNPHSASGNPDGWTLTRKDTANRVTSVETFAGSGKPAPFGSNSSSTGAVTTSYAADMTTVTDQAGKARQNRTDALGRLVQVIEDPGVLNYTTTYAYNALDSLTGVTQGSQTRTFAYDWLGRLTSATNPESGTTNYTYDGNGNLTSRTDALSRTTTMSYDRVDRVTLKDYPAGTPDVTYCYDGKVASGSPGVCQAGSGSGYPVRQLTEVSSSVSKTDYTYDALGRPLTSTQTTGATAYGFSYTWNPASALTSVTYPSGKTVSYCFDSAYRPVGVRTGSGSCTPGTAGVYAGNGSYAPHGALAQLQLGNSLWETTQYNSRLQPSAIKLGMSAGSDSVFGSALDYGTTNNNGNVLSQTITGSGLSKTQTYQYDGASRLSVASESGSAWSRNFGYDAKSNGWVSSWTGISPASFTPQSSTWFDSNNRLVNAGLGIQHDATGNQTAIGGYGFTFDAENRLATSTINSATTTNVYDGEGRRVKKVNPDQSQTVYVYNAMGQLAAEYASNPPAGGGTIYLTADHLGSTRVATSATGTTLARRDYLPFGEEIPSGIGSRTSLWSAKKAPPSQR